MSTHVKPKYIIGDQEYSQEELATLAVAIGNEKKATNPLILDLRNLGTAFTELFVILSAANNRQVYAIAEEIRMFFKNSFGLLPVGIDGLDTCTWVLIDYGFMFVHVFQEPTRDLYQLEQLWSKARSLETSEEIFTPLYKQTISSIEQIKKSNEQVEL